MDINEIHYNRHIADCDIFTFANAIWYKSLISRAVRHISHRRYIASSDIS